MVGDDYTTRTRELLILRAQYPDLQCPHVNFTHNEPFGAMKNSPFGVHCPLTNSYLT